MVNKKNSNKKGNNTRKSSLQLIHHNTGSSRQWTLAHMLLLCALKYLNNNCFDSDDFLDVINIVFLKDALISPQLTPKLSVMPSRDGKFAEFACLKYILH